MATMVIKTGRNDPCPCGSGKKYKRCCLEQDRQGQQVVRAAAAAALAARHAADDELGEWADALDTASNAVVDLVHAGQLDQAEQAAHALIVDYPDVHDGHDRLGMVYEALGEQQKAADCYRKVIELVRAHPGDYDAEFLTSYQKLVDELDPPAKPT